MLISVVNLTKIADAEVQRVLRSVNRQIHDDFRPAWHWSAQLRLEGKIKPSPTAKNGPPEELRGDAILYLWDRSDMDGALGYHDSNYQGLPFGIVFTKISEQLGEPWSVTLSHEALELIGDANVNTFAAGPHPKDPNRIVFHWYEMCDAVQTETYLVDEVAVSNFVLPLYFTQTNEVGARNDFLGTRTGNRTLPSFGVNPGGYVGFFDPVLQDHDTYSHDARAAERMKIKAKAGLGRRGVRYKQVLDETMPSKQKGRIIPGRARLTTARAKGNGSGLLESGNGSGDPRPTRRSRRPTSSGTHANS